MSYLFKMLAKKYFMVLLAICFLAVSCNKTRENNNSNTQIIVENPYPFTIAVNEGLFIISAEIESASLFEKYNIFFQQNSYSGNGYCWEGHIIQIIEKEDKELISHIKFDPEAGSFHAYADSEESQKRFVNLLSPIFSDLSRLEKYVKSADRNRIDD